VKTTDRFGLGLQWASGVLNDPVTTSVVAAGFSMRDLTEISEALGQCQHPVDDDGFCFFCDYPFELGR
jgi:hypothetical protein